MMPGRKSRAVDGALKRLPAHWSSVRIVPNLSIVDGINAARTVFNRCYFDETNVR